MATKPAVTPKSAPEKIEYLTVKLDLDSIAYTDKNGQEITVRAALAYFDSPAEAIGYAGSRQRTLNKDKARKAEGKPASRLYVNGNLPGDAATMAAQFRATMAAMVPSMAPKAPATPKAAPVAPLDLSDPLEAAVAVEMAAPAPVAPKAKRTPKAKPAPVVETIAPPVKAPEAPKAKPAGRKASDARVKAPKAAPVPVEPLKTAPVAPVKMPETIAPPASKMDAFKASAAAKLAAKLAAKKAANDAREGKV